MSAALTARPILFGAPMVRALLAGTKTQTRRTVKLPHENPLGKWEVLPWGGPNGGRTREGQTVPFQNVIGHSRTGELIGCPYGQPGDRLWVRETWAQPDRRSAGFPLWVYLADYQERPGHNWRPSIHMPRAASRITLEITGVRVERLQDISEADAMAEGCTKNHNGYFWGGPHAVSGLKQMATAVSAYRDLWESINGPGSWDANPWVWVVEFTSSSDWRGVQA